MNIFKQNVCILFRSCFPILENHVDPDQMAPFFKKKQKKTTKKHVDTDQMASHLENYVDPDQLATDRAIGSGLTLFSTILENYAYYLNIFFWLLFSFYKILFCF